MERNVLTTLLCLTCATAGALAHAQKSLSDSLWQANCDRLDGGRWKACYGPGWDEYQPRDPERYNFYEISVEGARADGSSTVLFTKRFGASEVDRQLLTRLPQRVVTFDSKLRRVTFSVAAHPVVVQIEE